MADDTISAGSRPLKAPAERPQGPLTLVQMLMSYLGYDDGTVARHSGITFSQLEVADNWRAGLRSIATAMRAAGQAELAGELERHDPSFGVRAHADALLVRDPGLSMRKFAGAMLGSIAEVLTREIPAELVEPRARELVERFFHPIEIIDVWQGAAAARTRAKESLIADGAAGRLAATGISSDGTRREAIPTTAWAGALLIDWPADDADGRPAVVDSSGETWWRGIVVTGAASAAVTTPTAAGRQRRPASEASIRSALDQTYNDAARAGTRPPNLREVGALVQRILWQQNVAASLRQIRSLAAEPHYRHRRLPAGHPKSRI